MFKKIKMVVDLENGLYFSPLKDPSLCLFIKYTNFLILHHQVYAAEIQPFGYRFTFTIPFPNP
jgi:hypothetical protein